MLSARNQRVLCIDNNFEGNSSIIAAGLYNPIVFKRLTKSWLADDLLPIAKQTYCDIESSLNESIDNKIDIVRLFSSIEQQNDWLVRSGDENLEKYLSNDNTSILNENKIPNNFGYGIVKQSGWINLPILLEKHKEYLTKNELFLTELFDYSKLVISSENISYKDITAKKIIFCEGSRINENPFFSYLPLKPTKGEVLTIEIDNLEIDKVLNKGFFILPLGENKFKVGATYNWADLTENPTQDGLNELTEKLKSTIPHKFKILKHEAGVRPTVIDRRPLIGLHPKHKNLAIFNGMGTKGVMIAPYFANQFSDFLVNQQPFDKTVDISRFISEFE